MKHIDPRHDIEKQPAHRLYCINQKATQPWLYLLGQPSQIAMFTLASYQQPRQMVFEGANGRLLGQ